MASEKDSVRIDLWLWAARFFKTRALAQKAVKGGKVTLNGQRVKPAREIKATDRLVVTKEDLNHTIDVLAVASKRLSAPLAQALYAETPQSQAEREAKIAQNRLERLSHASPLTRPDKKQRRQIRAMTRGD